MKRMIIGSIIVIFTIVTFIIGYVALYDPIALLSETLSDAYPSGEMFTSGETVQNILAVLPTFFIAAIAIGILMTMVWYMMWGHKKEYERY